MRYVFVLRHKDCVIFFELQNIFINFFKEAKTMTEITGMATVSTAS